MAYLPPFHAASKITSEIAGYLIQTAPKSNILAK